MHPFLIVAIQFSMGLAAYGLIFSKYVRPRLEIVDFHAAIAPMLLVHAFRFLGLTLLAPGQVDPAQDLTALQTIAFGDLAAGVVGLAAAIAAFQRSAATRPLAWLLTVVGLADFASVSLAIQRADVFSAGIGGMWFLQGLVAPVLVISHVYVIRMLLRGDANATITAPA